MLRIEQDGGFLFLCCEERNKAMRFRYGDIACTSACHTMQYYWFLSYVWGYEVTQLVEALRYKPEGRGFDSRWGHRNCSVTILLAELWPWDRLSL